MSATRYFLLSELGPHWKAFIFLAVETGYPNTSLEDVNVNVNVNVHMNVNVDIDVKHVDDVVKPTLNVYLLNKLRSYRYEDYNTIL